MSDWKLSLSVIVQANTPDDLTHLLHLTLHRLIESKETEGASEEINGYYDYFITERDGPKLELTEQGRAMVKGMPDFGLELSADDLRTICRGLLALAWYTEHALAGGRTFHNFLTQLPAEVQEQVMTFKMPPPDQTPPPPSFP